MRGRSCVAAIAALACALVVPAAQAAPQDPPPGANDFGCKPSAAHPRPVVLLHGLGANMRENWAYHSPRLRSAGYCVFALTYGLDPRTRSWPYQPGGVVKMEQSAGELRTFIDRVLTATGASEVDLVGHSQGTVMPRFYLERLGGAARVQHFVALTPLWRGTRFGGFALLQALAGPSLAAPFVNLAAGFCGACPQLVSGSDYLNALNADGEAVPGVEHTNIVTRYDVLVQPYSSGFMRDGGDNVLLQDVCPLDLSDHSTIAIDPVVTRLILNALDPASARPVDC